MMHPHHRNAIPRHNSCINNNIIMKTSNLVMIRSSSAEVQPFMGFSFSSASSSNLGDAFSLPLVGHKWRGSHATSSTTAAAAAAGKPFKFFLNPFSSIASMFRSLQSVLIPTCQLLIAPTSAPSPLTSRASRRRRRLMTGTFFGQKKGRVSFAVQETPRSDPVLLLELATPTAHLVREMASGTVRILLQCERSHTSSKAAIKTALLDEPMWTMYCNGRRLGYAVSRPCAPSDLHVLRVVEAVSAGAGVMPTTMAIPPPPPPPHPTEEAVGKNSDGVGRDQVMYMRAKFERVTGSRDSEAFYMINPDGGGKHSNGGPELSIFLLRI